MALDSLPIEGDWYETPEGQIFFVIALDENDGIAEVQYDDGTVGEIDLDAWNALEAEPIEPPENWVGLYSDLEEDEYADGSGEWEEPPEE